MNRIRLVVSDRPVASFFAATLAWTWTLWTASFAALDGAAAAVALFAGGFGPALAGAATTWLAGDSLRAWAGRLLRWRRSPLLWAAALLVPPAAAATVVPVELLLGGTPSPEGLPSLPRLAIGFVVVMLLTGGNEEPGWRGFALPRLQREHGPLAASVAVGLVWAAWHLPGFLLRGGLYHGSSFAWYVPAVVGISVVLTWLYNATDGSVLLCMALHASVNTLAQLPGELVAGVALPEGPAFALPYVLAALVAWAATGGSLAHGGGAVAPTGSDDRTAPT